MLINLFRNRTTEEVFYDHLEKRKRGLVEEDIAQNYSPAVVQLTCTGIYRGHEGVREGSKVLRQCLPEGNFEYYNTLVDGEMAFLEWKGFSDHKQVKEGADSFLIRDGWIVVQTIHYKVESSTSNTAEPADLGQLRKGARLNTECNGTASHANNDKED